MDTPFYDWCRQEVSAGHFIEDERIADWQYLTPIDDHSSAVVIGAGHGTMAMALARTCGRVVVLDPDQHRLAAVSARSRSQGLSHVETAILGADVPAMGPAFDLAAFRSHDGQPGAPGLGRVVSLAAALVRPGGMLSLTVENAWSLARLVGGTGTASSEAWSLRRYRRALRRAGFVVVSVHAVLPSVAAPPLFWVPLEPHSAFGYFLKDLAGLLDLASPEAKSGFARLRRIAGMGVRVTLALGAERSAAHFVPAFGILAKRIGD